MGAANAKQEIEGYRKLNIASGHMLRVPEEVIQRFGQQPRCELQLTGGTEWEQEVVRRINDSLRKWPRDPAAPEYPSPFVIAALMCGAALFLPSFMRTVLLLLALAAGAFAFMQKGGRMAQFQIDRIECILNTEAIRAHCTSKFYSGSVQPLLLFHGTKFENFDGIVKNNFKMDFHWWDQFFGLAKLDSGWYGAGAYFTSNVLYAQHYTHCRQDQTTAASGPEQATQHSGYYLPAVGGQAHVLGVWTAPGKIYQVTDMSMAGKRLKDGHDSHYAFVRLKTQGGRNDFFPCLTRDTAHADEYVIFSTKQLVPMFFITLRRTA